MGFDHWIHLLELFIIVGIVFVVASVVRSVKEKNENPQKDEAKK